MRTQRHGQAGAPRPGVVVYAPGPLAALVSHGWPRTHARAARARFSPNSGVRPCTSRLAVLLETLFARRIVRMVLRDTAANLGGHGKATQQTRGNGHVAMLGCVEKHLGCTHQAAEYAKYSAAARRRKTQRSCGIVRPQPPSFEHPSASPHPSHIADSGPEGDDSSCFRLLFWRGSHVSGSLRLSLSSPAYAASSDPRPRTTSFAECRCLGEIGGLPTLLDLLLAENPWSHRPLRRVTTPRLQQIQRHINSKATSLQRTPAPAKTYVAGDLRCGRFSQKIAETRA